MESQRRALTFDDLSKLNFLGDAQIHPDGKRVACVKRVVDSEKDEYVSRIWLWEDGVDRQYTAGPNDSTPRWSPDGKSLAFVAKREEKGKPRIYLLNSDGGEAVAITDKDWDVSGIEWSPDSKRIAFVRSISTDEFGVPKDPDPETEGSEEKKPKKASTKLSQRLAFKGDGAGFIWDKRRHIFVIDVGSHETIQITQGDFHHGSPAWSPDGAHIAFTANRNPNWDTEIDSQIWEVDSQGSEPRLVSSRRGMWDSPTYSPDGKQLTFAGDEISEDKPVTGFNRLWRIDVDGTNLTDLTGSADIEVGNSAITDNKLDVQDSFFWNDEGIWFIATISGASNIYRWDDGFHPMTEGQHDIRDFSLAGSAAAYTVADELHPAEIFKVSDIRSDEEPRQLTSANEALLSEVQLSTPERVSFTGSQGEEVEGWLLRPNSTTGSVHPLVLYMHGGPQAAYGYSFFHEMQALAGLGFGILLFNPHGSSSYGEAWTSAIHGDWGNRDFEDVMRAANMAAALEWVDEKKLAIAGGSYGGYITSWAIGHTDRFAAAIIERSLVNMLSFVGTTDIPNWWQYAWRTTIEKDPIKLWSMSPIAYLSQMSTPSLIIHSENDHRCPVEQGEQIFVGLRERGIPTRFVRFPEESHGLSRGGKPSRRLERLNEIRSWLEKYTPVQSGS